MADIPNPSTPAPQRSQIVAQARHLLGQGQLEQTARLLIPLANQQKPDPEALYLLGVIAKQQSRFEDATQIAKRSLQEQEHPDTLLLLASCLRETGDLESCLQICDRLIRRKPGNLSPQILKADALQEAGQLDEAESILTAISKGFKSQAKPVPTTVLGICAKFLMQQHDYAEAIKTTDAILNRPSLPPATRKTALFSKVKACDRSGQFELAFQTATEAHTLNSTPFDPDQHEAGISHLIANWSSDLMADYPVSSCDSSLPVFIAGMPRSGTSLLDQIIDAHPQAAGVGELGTILRFAAEIGANYDPSKPPQERFGSCNSARWTEAAWEYVNKVEQLAPPNATRIVNKALGNDMIVGLIAKLFPATKIIHIRRDPRDVAISCYTGEFNNTMFPWTARPDWTAKAWEQSERLMTHWKETLDIPILEIRYEDLASNPEGQIPGLLEFLGLEPDEKCFEFYKSKRRVRTLSHDQVSRPMYTSSIGRYENYEAFVDLSAFPEYP